MHSATRGQCPACGTIPAVENIVRFVPAQRKWLGLFGRDTPERLNVTCMTCWHEWYEPTRIQHASWIKTNLDERG